MSDQHLTTIYANPWDSISVWADDSTQLDSLRPNFEVDALDTTEALEAAQTWQEVLTVPVAPRDNLAYFAPIAPTTRRPREQAPISERPDRGRIVWTVEGMAPENVGRCEHHYTVKGETVVVKNTGTITTLAHDGSPVTERGTSSARSAVAAKAQATKQAKRAAKLNAFLTS